MTEENIWKVYNFVNDWKSGKYGIMDIETCAQTHLHIIEEHIDEKKLDELAKKIYPITNEIIDYQYGSEDTNKQKRDAFKVGYRRAKKE